MFLGGSLRRFSSSRCFSHNHFYGRWWWSSCRCWFRNTFYNWRGQRCCLSRCRFSRCRFSRCCRWVSSNLSPETLNYCVGDLDYSCSLIIDNSDLPGTLVGTHLDQEGSLSLFPNLTSTLISCRSESSNKSL